MKKVRTHELTGDALVAAVAMCEGYTNLHKIEGRMPHEPQFAMMPPRREFGAMELWEIGSDCDWRWLGPIIEREWIAVNPWPNESNEDSRWIATRYEQPAVCEAPGPTPLIAAMRCFVASKLGDEVEVPDELFDYHR